MDIGVLTRVMQPDYKPLDQDILATRIKTNGSTKMSFVHDFIEYEFVDVGGQKNERRKWQAQMKNVDMLIYLISLSDFDETLYEDEEDTSRMIEALDVFPKTIEGEWFSDKPVLILWNKKENLEKKLQHVDPSVIWTDYQDGKNVDKCIEFIKSKFMEKIPKMSQTRMQHRVGSAIYEETIRSVFDEVTKVARQMKKDEIERLKSDIIE